MRLIKLEQIYILEWKNCSDCRMHKEEIEFVKDVDVTNTKGNSTNFARLEKTGYYYWKFIIIPKPNLN